MNCHQILSGACNAGDRCFAVGSVEGVPFTAYAAGCNIVVLASNFERVQIIPGAVHNYIRISALDASTDTGKIAAAYEDKVCIFEPTPLIHTDRSSTHGLEYKWVQTGSLQAASHISSLSWNLEGTRLLTGGTVLQLWHERLSKDEDEPSSVKFEIGGSERDPKTPTGEEESDSTSWDCVWKCHTATPVHHMAFSPDGTLFATSGKSDRLVKVWYENKHILFPNKSFDQSQSQSSFIGAPEVSYGFVYVAHPRAVTHLSWRKTSKYMPKGSVSNMLVTSCLDNICRIWVETVLPDDGLVNMNQFDPLASQNPKFRTHRHKHRFMQRLKHMKTCFHIRRHAKHGGGGGVNGLNGMGAGFGGPGASSSPGGFGNAPIPTLPSTYSVHDFHSYGYHGTGMTPGLHFHLAASINAETDIPLVPSLHTTDPAAQPNFILHWLNNKEMHFTPQAEGILQEITRKVIEKEDQQQHTNVSGSNSDGGGGMEAAGGGASLLLEEEGFERRGKLRSALSQEESNSNSEEGPHPTTQHRSHSIGAGSLQGAGPGLSNTTSINSLANDHHHHHHQQHLHVTDSLDMKIECLLRDWHHSPDLLFSIHPIDGSYLIWVVEWLDEYHPGSFRQAQVSFSTRIPSAFPLGDAMSMSTTVALYNTGGNLGFRDMIMRGPKSSCGAGGIAGSSAGQQQDGIVSEAGITSLPSVLEENEADENAAGEQGSDAGGYNQDGGRGGAGDGDECSNNEARDRETGEPLEQQDILTAPPSPTISMVTKHSNGTLNLWQLTFADRSKFSQVLSIGHASRASGHRFRVNDITCHPVLPLLLTTSHHNIPDIPSPTGKGVTPGSGRPKDVFVPTGFCSELILWRVDAVGPLSQSGGVSELARINSPEISAFSNVAWIPTLLPSTTLGNLSNSPSACFVASDGECLRVYQAVIDARTLLAEISSSERRCRRMDSLMSLSTESSESAGLLPPTLHDRIKIVSQQSTARPGCIIQLDAIDDATHDWQNTQFLHVFQEQLITGERTEVLADPFGGSGNSNFTASMGIGGESTLGAANDSKPTIGLMDGGMGAMVDLQRNAQFEQPFYLVVLERTQNGTTLHMWRIVIASQPATADDLSSSMIYVPDSNLVQDLDDPENLHRPSVVLDDTGRASSAGHHHHHHHHQRGGVAPDHASHVNISTTKVCTQELPLPDGVDVIHAAPAAGHLSSSSIYPACFAPYIIVTACSDSTVRFWKCKTKNRGADRSSDDPPRYEWCEWEMIRKDQESTIDVSGQLLHISAAYSGRIACAYKYGKSFTRPTKSSDPESRFVNLSVAIYECESTGGSEWVLEDTIHLKNIHLPRIQMDHNLDLSYLYDTRTLQKKQRLNQVLQTLSHDDGRSPRSVNGDVTPEALTKPPGTGLLAVPSFSTLQSLRKSITEHGNTCPITQKHLVQLDWVSKEDGSHILTVAVGSKILLFTPVSSDLAQSNMKAMKESQSTNRPLLRKASSLAQPHFNDEIRWMKLRQIELTTADGLPPLPMQISWVRDGIFVAGMDSEMHVYSQWKPQSNSLYNVSHPLDIDDLYDTRNLKDEDLRSMAQDSTQRRLANVSSMPVLSRVSSINLNQMMSNEAQKKKKPPYAAASTGQLGSVASGVSGEPSQPSGNAGHDYMTDYGLFEASRIACPVLPQYHPKQLMELLNSGKIRWVKAILAHLVRCISGSYTVRGCGGDEESLNRQRGWSRTRTLSISCPAGTVSPLEPRGSTTQIPEELTLDYAEITSIPPLPLWTLLAADKESTGSNLQQTDEVKDYNELFESNIADESLDDLLDDESGGGEMGNRHTDRRSSLPEKHYLSHFGPRQGQLLSRLLTHTHLPGLSSLDQMHLLALADTVSTCNIDFAERFAIDAAKTAIAKENLTGVPNTESVSTDSLDDCGLRFLLAMKHYNYLLRCLPISQRQSFQRQGVGTGNIVWAFHSESEEELLNLIPSYVKGQPKWHVLKELGVGWWLRNNSLLRQCIERLAKASFQANQDPLDAAIYYMAMKKKSVVWGLFRSKRDEKMTQFFANNFSEDRWRKAALKNAFALLGKQRFEHAVAFFLLANSLNDALEVCLTKLEDLQLALVITRLYEGEHDATPPSFRRLLYEEVLGCDKNGENQDLSRAHPDPFLRSMALWILKDYTGSLSTLLDNQIGSMHPLFDDEGAALGGPSSSAHHDSSHSTNPNVFNFYVYLRTHPLLIRQHIASSAQDKKRAQVVIAGFSYGGGGGAGDGTSGIPGASGATDKQIQLEDSITPLERQLYFTTAHAHFKAGCPALALEVLSKLPTKVIDQETSSTLQSPVGAAGAVADGKDQSGLIATGILDWSNNTASGGGETSSSFDWGASSNSTALDWGAPVSGQLNGAGADDGFKIVWDDDDAAGGSDEDDDGGIQIKSKPEQPPTSSGDSKGIDASAEPVEEIGGSSLDIMAQQLKFIACLKILMEELSTLATGFEVDGGQLRYQLYVWLEREVEALKQLCNYSTGDSENTAIEDTTMTVGGETTIGDRDTPVLANKFPQDKPTLHEILIQEKQDFEAKVHRAARRKRWLKANETLLRTLLSYCSLHGASGGGLASVRMELVLLLQELQQEKTQQQLLSPLPFPTTLPLLSACVAGNKTVIADPLRYLQSHTHDMLQTMVNMRMPPHMNRAYTFPSGIFVLRDLAVALSACIYQSLCDSDTFSVKQSGGGQGDGGSQGCHSPGMETIAKLNASCQSTHLMANAAAHQRRRKYSTDEPLAVSTPPSKWPGVTNLRALLAREKDEDTPRLNVLLCESFVAAYMALFVYALTTCDSHILYRLAGQNFTDGSWSTLFGGGVKKLLRKATSQAQAATGANATSQTAVNQMQQQEGNDSSSSAVATASGDTGSAGAAGADGSVWGAVTSLTKQRVKLNMKLLGHFAGPQGASNMKEDKPTYREQFVPPEMSMVSYFLTKPIPRGYGADEEEYDSADSATSDMEEDEEDEDVFNDPLNNDPKASQVSAAVRKHRLDNTEHSNPNSYSWCIMRFALIRVAQSQLQQFIAIAGIEMQELPVCSPLVHGILRSLSTWQDLLKEELENRGPASVDYIPGCFVESEAKGPAIHKYRSLLERSNTPFSPCVSAAAPAKRLWNYLVRIEAVQDIFIRAVFGKKKTTTAIPYDPSIGGGASTAASVVDAGTPVGHEHNANGGGMTGAGIPVHQQNVNIPEPVRIIHKDQEQISAFCLNMVNPGLLALATPREVQEMDIALLLESPNWMEDECEMDIMNLSRDIESLPSSSFLVIQTATDKHLINQNISSAQNYGAPSSPQPGIAGQSGRGASVIKGATFPGSQCPRFCKLVIDRSKHLLKPVLKHKVDNIKRMSAHPLMPLYLTGGQDGSVQMWEWGHQQVVCTPRSPGTFAKVTRCRFSQHGNKFGIADGDGNLSLWQVGLASQNNRPFFTYICHNKGITDFVFLGSCSLVATAGHSSESKNVAIWDTLLPQKKALVSAFTCHDQGASSLAYAPQHQLLISAGKKGDVNIFDVRQRVLRHRFQAHEHPIKCLAIDPNEEHFVTGSADGDIKVWGLTVHTQLYSFMGEHARSSFFKHIGQGVTQLQIDQGGRLFSCGADGSMKVRQLPDRESIIHSLY
ncbi:dmX-like protein 2 isoform X1 [Anopheles albimanus]|uniref:dmX-like protein 2 isoform X1 n=1 Tax=Anopheles albimanus TaxID=7167 RepID=UPI00163E4EA4|nr:dmX-like protein 2 isoform X1 [Anopheles albimanus]